MNTNLTFKERAEIAMKMLEKQGPVTLEEARAQAKWIKAQSMKDLEYKGYSGSVEYSKEDNVFFGKILNIKDLVSFEGDTLDELKNSFIESVNDYVNE